MQNNHCYKSYTIVTAIYHKQIARNCGQAKSEEQNRDSEREGGDGKEGGGETHT
jgi:hypothetical protein